MFLQPRKMSAIGLLLLVTVAAPVAQAQTANVRTQAGEEFQYSDDASVRVLECYARNGIDYCLVNWGIVSQGFWSVPVEVWRQDLDILQRKVVVAHGPNVDGPVVPEPSRPIPVGIPGCDPSVFTGFVPDTVAPSEDLFRAKITDLFTMRAYDNWYYGVEFYSFEVGAPLNNDVTIDGTLGALLATFGAPPNVPLYPVTTTFRVCEKESASTFVERFHDSDYYCFPKDGEWTCGVSQSR